MVLFVVLRGDSATRLSLCTTSSALGVVLCPFSFSSFWHGHVWLFPFLSRFVQQQQQHFMFQQHNTMLILYRYLTLTVWNEVGDVVFRGGD